MAKKGFDPFDEDQRNKVKRRKPEEVAADRLAWDERVLNHFRRAMESMCWPDYVDSECINALVLYNPETNVGIDVIKRNFRWAMDRLEYDKYVVGKNQSGRWKVGGVWTVVYFKRGATKIDKSELKQALER